MIEPEEFEPDGHYLPSIKPHSLKKLRLHNYFTAVFAQAMHKKWPNLVYVGLYSGAGAAQLDDSGKIVQTSALSVLTQPVGFTHYIFVDSHEECVSALRSRAATTPRSASVEVIHADVNQSAEQVQEAIPDYKTEGGVLSLCFVDPFRIDLDFSVIRRLSVNRMDFLIMIPLGYDVRRNRKDYLDRPEARDRLGRFIDDPHWHEEWLAQELPDSEFQRFIHGKLNAAMARLGYQEQEMKDAADVKVSGMGVYLYSLALYSKHKLGSDFWKQTLRGTSEQRELDL